MQKIENVTREIKDEDCSDSDEEECYESIKAKIPNVQKNI